MTITAKVRKRMIENGRLVHAIVQGESNATTILFRIEGETDLVAEDTLFLYLLYKRPNDQTVQLPILLDYTIEDGVILATFTPGAYFTADAGPVEISVIATSSAAELGGSGEVTNTLLWSSFPAWLLVAPSQLADSSTIIEENVFTQYLAELEALDADAKDYASDAEEYAKGTRSDGGTVTHATDNAKYYKNLAKDWAMKTGGPVEGVEMSAKVYAASSQNYATESQQWANKMDGKVLGTDYSAKYYAGEASDSAYAAGQSAESAAASAQIVEDHAEAIEAIADDLTNIDSVAGKLTEIGTVAGDLANIDAVAGNKTNIDAVNANKTNIDTVAGKTTEITTVAGKANDVTTVAGIASDVTKVAAVDDDVSAVAAIDSDVSAVAAAASDVTAVSGALSDISDVATDLNDDDSAIRAVAADMTGVSAVAADLANIDAVAADLANIDNAEANALKAEGWANGTQNGTPVSSDSPYYENNAKYWADAVPDLKDAIQANSNRISNLEQEHGGYVTVNYRGTNAVPTGKAKYALVESIVGKSRAWNSLGKAQTSGSVITRINDYSVSVSFDSSFTRYPQVNESTQTVNGHKYLVYYKQTSGTNLRTSADGIFKYYDASTIEAGKAYIADGDGTTNVLQVTPYTAGVGGNGTFTFLVRDLTLIFPEGVPSTVAECVQKFPDLLTYDAYGTSIVDETDEGVESIGFNRSDEQWENGLLNLTTGQPEPNASYSRSKNFCGCDPSKTYYLHNTMSNVTQLIILWYDINKSYLGYSLVQTNPITPLDNACYFKFRFNVGSVVGTLCFNVSQPNTSIDPHDGQYLPFMADTLSLPSSVTLRSAGSVADTDELNVEVNGVARRRQTTKVGSVEYGDMPNVRAYTGYNNHTVIADAYTGMARPSSNDYSANILCAKYMTIPAREFFFSTTPTGIAEATGGAILICDTSYDTSNPTSLASFIASVENLLINYEVVEHTVTLLDPIENNTIQTEGGGTINTIQNNVYPDESPAPTIDNCMDVGYLAL